MVWGYTGRFKENLGGTKSGDGHYSFTGATVDPGFVRVVQALYIRNTTGARGAAWVCIRSGGADYMIGYTLTPGVAEIVLFNGAVVLQEGDAVKVAQLDCIDLDVIEARAWGYRMRISE